MRRAGHRLTIDCASWTAICSGSICASHRVAERCAAAVQSRRLSVIMHVATPVRGAMRAAQAARIAWPSHFA
jgi:hypothetical protein